MPCRSDYLEPNFRERELRRAAQLLVHVYGKLGVVAPKYALGTAKDQYARDDRSVMRLCAVLSRMTARQLDRIVYDAHDKTARELATWWEEHQEADRRRKADEAAEKRRARKQASGLAKLSKEERRALDLE